MQSADLSGLLRGIPPWVIALTVLLGTAVLAAAILGGIRLVLRRMIRRDGTLYQAVLADAGGVAQLALTLLAAEIVTPLLPITAGASDIVKRCLLAAFIILLGWIAILISDLAINRYVHRFKINTADNLLARKAVTQMHMLKRTVDIAIGVIAVGLALMTFDAVRQFGISLFASAGIAGLAIGFAAKPLLGNLVAGIQIAITQPIRIDDAVVIDNQWGWVEEITATYVVVRIWDWRRLVVPLSYLLENPFENWTRTTASIIGSVTFYVDYMADVDRIRAKVEEVAKASKLWDGQVVNVQVTDTTEHTLQVRALVTGRNSGQTWDLRCEVRERVLAWMRQEYPEALPRWRAQIDDRVGPMAAVNGQERPALEHR